MIDGREFNRALSAAGIDFFTGVPCSLLGAAMHEATKCRSYVGATSEGEALAIASGAWLAGSLPVVFLQNSGLGNLVNPLTSLNTPFGIPALLVIGWRGMPGYSDEPQHETMGSITRELLELMDIPCHILPDTLSLASDIIKTSVKQMHETRKPVALLVPPTTFNSVKNDNLIERNELTEQKNQAYKQASEKLPTRFEILQSFVDNMPKGAAVIATTGKCGRELFTIKDSEQHLYMVGAMGSASAVALGVALKSQNSVIVIDGDGAALMRLGTFATIGREAPENLVHIVLDNATHDSTGGQSTGSEHVNFCAIAAACGYATYTSAAGADAFIDALLKANASTGPHFIHVPITIGSQPNLARPDIAPYDVATRLAAFLKRTN